MLLRETNNCIMEVVLMASRFLRVKVKVKVKLSLCLINYHDMKTCWLQDSHRTFLSSILGGNSQKYGVASKEMAFTVLSNFVYIESLTCLFFF